MPRPKLICKAYSVGEREREQAYTPMCVHTGLAHYVQYALANYSPAANCQLPFAPLRHRAHANTDTHTQAYTNTYTHTMRRTQWIRTPTSHTLTHSAKVLHALLELCVCACCAYIYVCMCVCVCLVLCVSVLVCTNRKRIPDASSLLIGVAAWPPS